LKLARIKEHPVVNALCIMKKCILTITIFTSRDTSYAAGIPTCLLATYLVESRGLKFGIRIGSILTGLGGFLCCVGTFPGLSVYIPIHVQYWMALLGQAATGVACPFISCVPTKED